MKRLTPSQQRFLRFKRWLRDTTGDRCHQYAGGRVFILRNQFSPERDFLSLGDAIDNFSYLMSESDYRALH